jgi:hypothetical protein
MAPCLEHVLGSIQVDEANKMGLELSERSPRHEIAGQEFWVED